MSPEAALQQVSTALMTSHGVALPKREAAWLYELLRAGHQRAVQRQDIARFDAEVANLSVQLIAGIVLQQRVDGAVEVSSASILKVVRRLCPIWPFC